MNRFLKTVFKLWMWNRGIKGRKVKLWILVQNYTESDLRIWSRSFEFFNIHIWLTKRYITVFWRPSLTVGSIVSNLERGLVEYLDEPAIYLSLYVHLCSFLSRIQKPDPTRLPWVHTKWIQNRQGGLFCQENYMQIHSFFFPWVYFQQHSIVQTFKACLHTYMHATQSLTFAWQHNYSPLCPRRPVPLWTMLLTIDHWQSKHNVFFKIRNTCTRTNIGVRE